MGTRSRGGRAEPDGSRSTERRARFWPRDRARCQPVSPSRWAGRVRRVGGAAGLAGAALEVGRVSSPGLAPRAAPPLSPLPVGLGGGKGEVGRADSADVGWRSGGPGSAVTWRGLGSSAPLRCADWRGRRGGTGVGPGGGFRGPRQWPPFEVSPNVAVVRGASTSAIAPTLFPTRRCRAAQPLVHLSTRRPVPHYRFIRRGGYQMVASVFGLRMPLRDLVYQMVASVFVAGPSAP